MSDVEKRITAKMILDSTGFNENIRAVNRNLALSQSELKLASEGVKAYGRDSESLKNIQGALASQIEANTLKASIYRKGIEKESALLEDNTKKRDETKRKLEEANAAYEKAEGIYGKNAQVTKEAKEEVKALTEELKKNEGAVSLNAGKLQGYQGDLNKTEAEIIGAKNELKKLGEELDKSNNKWITASEKLADSSEKLKSVGSKMQSAGDSLLKISAPLVGAGVAASKLSTDFNAAMANIGTLIPNQVERLNELKASVQEVSVTVGKGTTDIADGTYQVISAFGDAADTMEKVELNAMASVAGLSSTKEALELASSVMKGYGDTSADSNKKVLDLAFTTVKLGQTDFPSLAGSIGKVVPLSNELKVSQEELFAIYATGTGVTGNASEVSTQYRGVLQSLLAPTTEMTKLISEMGVADGKALIEKKGLAGTIDLIVKKSKESNTPLQKYIGSIEGQTLALAIAGEQSSVYKEKLSQMSKSQGAMKEAFDQQTKGINENGFSFQQSMIKMQTAGQKFGDAIAPLLGEFAQVISNIADKISQMDEKQIKAIVNVGKFTLGLGGILKVGGGAVSAVGSIAGGLSKLTGALGTATTATAGIGSAAGLAGGVGGLAGLGTALGGAVVAAAPFVLAGAAVVGAGVAIHHCMKQDVIPTVDLFADKMVVTAGTTGTAYGQMAGSIETSTIKISESTQKAVGAYMKMDEDVSKELLEIYANSQEITQRTVNQLVEKYSKMNDDIKTGMENRHLAQYEDMKNFFIKSASLTDQEEKDALKKLEENNNENQKKMDEHVKRINEILSNAKKDKRQLTLDEQKEISAIQDEMKVTAVETLSETEVESKVILERLKQHSTRITAEQASDIIKSANETKEKSIAAAEEQYKKTLENIIKMRDESKVISEEQAKKLIDDAVKQKEDCIKEANLMKEGVVGKLRDMNSDILKDIDENDGEIKSRWQKMKDWFFNNPIVRFFVDNSTPTAGLGSQAVAAGKNWTGTNYWRGGLTTLHDVPGKASNYELYDLPRGTRIYNHDASSDLVLKTAESVARQVMSNMMPKGNGGINVTQNFYDKTPTPSEIARQSKNHLRELALNL